MSMLQSLQLPYIEVSGAEGRAFPETCSLWKGSRNLIDRSDRNYRTVTTGMKARTRSAGSAGAVADCGPYRCPSATSSSQYQ